MSAYLQFGLMQELLIVVNAVRVLAVGLGKSCKQDGFNHFQTYFISPSFDVNETNGHLEEMTRLILDATDGTLIL